MDQPLVSIIIPAYNAAAYVREAVDSALAQTYPAVEIIVVDDGSVDGTREVLELYIKKGSIRYIRQENKGLAAARNAGIRNARGEFVALLDSDDLFLPEKMERQVGYLVAHPECGVSYCAVWHFKDEQPEKLLKLKGNYSSGKDVFPMLLRRNFIIPLSVVFRKSEIDRVGFFNEDFRRAEDWEYWLRLSYRGVQFVHLPLPLAKCRLHAGSWSQGSDGWKTKIKERQAVLDVFNDLCRTMAPGDRRRYHVWIFILENKIKLWYVVLGSRFSPLQWPFRYIQESRWE